MDGKTTVAAGDVGIFLKSGSLVEVTGVDRDMLSVERLDTRKGMAITVASLARPGDPRLGGDSEEAIRAVSAGGAQAHAP